MRMCRKSKLHNTTPSTTRIPSLPTPKSSFWSHWVSLLGSARYISSTPHSAVHFQLFISCVIGSECERRANTFCFCYASVGHVGIKHSNQIFVLVLREAVTLYTEYKRIRNDFTVSQTNNAQIYLARVDFWMLVESISEHTKQLLASLKYLYIHVFFLGVVCSSFTQACSWDSGFIYLYF